MRAETERRVEEAYAKRELLKSDELPGLRAYPETAWLRDAVKAEA